MFDPKRMLEDFLGGSQGAGQGGSSAGRPGGSRSSGAGTFAAGAAAGGLVGLLLGSKKAKKIGGNLLGYGGAAVLGGLAYKAWQNYQTRQQQGGPAQREMPAEVPGAPLALPLPEDSPFDPGVGRAADGRPFALALVRAMIAASKADGHIDAREQTQLFDRIEELQLDADAKAFVFDELGRPTDLDAIAALPSGPEQAAEIWLASRLAIDPDDVREKAYMSALAAKLRLPPDLLNQLEIQAKTAAAAVVSGPAG